MVDMEQLADSVFDTLKAYVDAEIGRRDAVIQALRTQIAAIPAGKDGAPGADGAAGRDGEAGKDGRAGVDGKSVAPEDLEPMVAKLVRKAADAIPVARDGRDGTDGRDGASVPLEAVQALVRAEVSREVAALPKPTDGRDGKPGENGKDGAPGKDGQNGRDGVNGERGADGKDGAAGTSGLNGKDGADAVIDVNQVVEALKSDPEAVAMLRGAAGPQGERGGIGASGQDGRDGTHGKDGADAPEVTTEQLREAVEHRFATWALDFERLATDRQRAAIDSIPLPRDGRDGHDGKPGAGMDDFELQTDIDDRVLRFQLSACGRTATHAVKLPMVIDRGVWVSSKAYETGDAVTFGGQIFFAQRDTQARPGDSPDWRLAVRRGRDGKDAAE